MKRYFEAVLWTLSVGALLAAAMVSSRPFLLFLATVWIVSTAIVIPLHFYRAWKRWAHVSNRRAYAVWVGFETAATLALISLGIFAAISR
jgi:hypothetical protein